MKITLIQFETKENIEENIEALEQIQIESGTICMLPELWLVPFDNEKIKEARAYEQQAREAMAKFSRDHKALLIGGTIPHEQNGQWYNTCFIYDQGNEIAHYSKMHLLEVHAKKDYFESDVFTPGNKFVTFSFNGVRCGVIVCYDVRFPELARLLSENIEILFVPAAFNDRVGPLHWRSLLQARAIENEIFVAACAPSYSYQHFTSYGHSMIVDPFGRIVIEAGSEPKILSAEIQIEEVNKIRKRMPLAKQRRNDLYEIIKKREEA